MNLYPRELLNKVEEITIEFIQKNKLKALILDVDNTLIDTDKNLSVNVQQDILTHKMGHAAAIR